MRAAPAVTSRRRWAFGVILTTQFMIVLDVAIVYIALPEAQGDLGISTSDRQWVVTAYTIASGGLLLLGGRAGDILGRKRMLVWGLAGFAAASAVAGAAPNAVVLFAGRALQGVCAAALAPAALALTSLTFPGGPERARAFAAYGAVSGGGAATGLMLGGIITEYASWRWCLLVTVPVAAVAAAAALIAVRDEPVTVPARFDFPGALAGTGGLVALVYASATRTWVPVLVAAVLLAAFVVVEARGREPLLPPRVVLERRRAALYTVAVIGNAAQLSAALFLTYHFQSTLDLGALSAGSAFLPFAAGVVSGAYAMGRLLPRTGARPLILAGGALGASALTVVAGLGMGPDRLAVVLVAEVVLGFGVAFNLMPLNSVVLIGVDPRDAGVASALLNTTQPVGTALGTALLNMVFVAVAAGYGTETASRVAFLGCAALFALTVAVTAGRFHDGDVAPERRVP